MGCDAVGGGLERRMHTSEPCLNILPSRFNGITSASDGGSAAVAPGMSCTSVSRRDDKSNIQRGQLVSQPVHLRDKERPSAEKSGEILWVMERVQS